ncbi:cytochrome P450 family protein [Actinacidiphila yeochonensis]|uniref:cytochrome P450 n=1 Tax=Actinacidiphila yeochonensis TaxID=89050 RepID=UPI00055ECC1C|nr:cytochrome P450 [Actinacidiphila yeochonensis]
MTPQPSAPALDPTAPERRYPLYSQEYAAAPHAAYEKMRAEYGPLVPVELSPGVPATLVIGYPQALRILNDPVRFPADPRQWQRTVPDDCPVKPMMEWRPNALRSSGDEHARYRAANTFSLDRLNQHRLRATVQRVASETIASFSPRGTADLLTEYAWPIVFRVLNEMLGCPADIGQRVADGMAAIFEGVDAAAGNAMLGQAVYDLTLLKRENPAEDVVSWLIAHGSDLNDEEMGHQIVTLFGAGIEPTTNLITNTLLLLLTDDRFSGNLHAGSLSVRDALDELLFADPPMASYCVSYPPQPVDVDGFVLPPHQPVVICMSAANNDPTIGASPGVRAGNRAHLAWSNGPHQCPAKSHAYLIAETAMVHLLDALPEMDLAVPEEDLTWRPGPWHRALASLPVVFPPVTPVSES